MKILIIGAGNMGAWFVEELCLDHEVAIYDIEPKKLKYFFKSFRFTTENEIEAFKPQLLINAVSLHHTIEVFDQILPLLPKDCIISDIASVKAGIHEYYNKHDFPFISTHPMFGPTFANLKDLSNHNAIIIKESDETGKKFFRTFYKMLNLNIYEYTFEEHDRMIAYSLSIPFTTTLAFASCLQKIEAPGTTFRKHLELTQGLLSENDYLISEVLFNPYTLQQVEKIKNKLEFLIELIRNRKQKEMHEYFKQLRNNLK